MSLTPSEETTATEVVSRLLVRFQTVIIDTRLYLGVIAAMEVLVVSILLDYPLTLAPLIFCLLTFSVYLNDQLLDFNADELDSNRAAQFVAAYRDELYVFGAVAYGMALALSVLGGPLAFAVTLVPGGAWILYATDLIRSLTARVGVSFSGLKDVFLLNTTVVALAWTGTLTVLPLAFANAAVTPQSLLVSVYFFIRVWVNTETSNLPDVAADRAAGVTTLPTKLGVSATRLILYGLNLATVAMLAVATAADIVSGLFAAVLALGAIYSFGVVALSRHSRRPRLTQIAEYEFAIVFLALAAVAFIRGRSINYFPGELVPATAGLVLLLAVGIGTAAVILAWRERPEPGALPMVVMLAGGVWWAVTLFSEFQADSVGAMLAASNAGWLGVVVIPVGWLLFALEYTGRTGWLQLRYLVGVVVVPLLTIFIAATAPYNTLLYRGFDVATVGDVAYLIREPGPWYWIVTAYTYLLGGVGVVLLLKLVVSNRFTSRRQALTLVVGTLAPWVTNVAFVTDQVPVDGLDPTPLAFTVTGVAYLGAMTRFELLGSTPTPSRNAPEVAFERMELAAVVIDRNGFLVEVNEEGCDLFDADPTDLLGRQCDAALPALASSLSVDDPPSRQTVTIDDRPHEAVMTPVTDPYNRTVSYIVTLSDVSGYLRRQEQLKVLNRTFRHDVRTKLQLLAGTVATVDDRGTDQIDTSGGDGQPLTHTGAPADPRRVIKEIDELGSKVRELIRVFELERDDSTVPLATVIEANTETFRQSYPDAVIETDPIPPVRVGEAARFVVNNVLENALEHNNSTTPRVVIGCETTTDTVTIIITDNGPGINEDQLSVLRQRCETDVKHLDGLGLWLTVWGMDVLDGDVSFKRNNPVGTIVRLVFPVAARPGDDSSAGTDSV